MDGSWPEEEFKEFEEYKERSQEPEARSQPPKDFGVDRRRARIIPDAVCFCRLWNACSKQPGLIVGIGF